MAQYNFFWTETANEDSPPSNQTSLKPASSPAQHLQPFRKLNPLPKNPDKKYNKKEKKNTER